ncbi:hypothetical protein WJX72_000155 [[Myrmecia] bisecta]|uniref:glutamine synthetase n=1 Tax=[Myrmecia] bisecta TaxID=41462 RepID=A0AAW1PWV1_9CHLO
MLDRGVEKQFTGLHARGKWLAEYVWLGGTGADLHSKTKVLNFKPEAVEQLPTWHYDGSTTGQAPDGCGIVYLKPRAVFPDPFRGGEHILVLCDTFSPPVVEGDGLVADMMPHATNNRAPCERAMQQAAGSDPVFSVEQQYTLLDPSSGWPVGWPEVRAGTSPPTSGYCGAGVGVAVGREFSESHVRACIHAGLQISGINADVVPGQWSYSIGPCRGTQLGDQLWMSRYLLLRMSEKFSVIASTDPKPVPGDWGGNGASVKFSTRETREQGKGWFVIQNHIRSLQAAHLQHIMVYGCGNAKRLTGMHKTSSVLHFTWGLENRSASIRIPHSVVLHQRGYYEDRRPASNMDPYLVSMMLVCTTLGVPLPVQVESVNSLDSASESEELTRGSSAILADLDAMDSFAPDTPPQHMSLLSDECSSQNYPTCQA